MKKLTSKSMRNDSLFMRNDFERHGRWEIPLIKKQSLEEKQITLIACSDTRKNDIDVNKSKGVHFFVDDYRFYDIYNHPEKTIEKYSQYSFLLSPDFSTYADMPLWRQLESVSKNRWCGAFWQSKGLTVYPTISWGDALTYSFCFDGVEKGSVVAIGMVGCRRNKKEFMRGYNAMLERINPSKIICFGHPFDEMKGNIIEVDYRNSRKVVR